MLTNTERQQIVEEVNAGTYGIDEALDDIAAAQKGEEVRKALYAEALVLNREGHAGSTDMIARQQIANLQTSVNGQISTLRTEVGEDIDDLEEALNSGLATQNGRIAAQNATIANVVANYNVEYGSTELWASTGETGALAAGTTVTLSEDVSHFDYIDIYSFCGNSNVLDTVPVDAKLQSSQGYALRWVNLSDPDSGSYKAYVRIIETRLHIIGTTLTIDHQVTYRNGEEVNISGAEITQSNRSTYMGELGIMKIVGRKITANTEIEDVRIGADGTEYNSAGQAVRAQVQNLNNVIYDTKDSISDFATLKNGVSIRYYQPLASGFGHVKADGTVRSDTDTLAYDTNYMPVHEGDVITSLGTTRDAIRFICAYDYQMNPVVSAGSDNIVYRYRVPSGVSYIRVTLYTNSANDYRTMPALKIVSAGGFYAISEIENVTALKKNVQFDLVKDIGAVGFGWINADGAYYADSDEVLAYSNFVLVDEGDVIKSNGVGHVTIRFIAAYDDTQTVMPSAGSNDSVLSYTVPSGVRYIRVTMHVETAHNLASFPSITVHKSGNYVLPIIDETLTSEVYPAPAKVVGYIAADRDKPKSITRRGNLGASDKWEFEENNISTSKVLSFSGQIASFSEIQMGHGASESESNYIRIDGTNVYEYGGGTLLNTYPHGLTIANTIQVKIEIKAENAYNAYLTLISNGDAFSQTMPRWYGDSGALFVESVGSVLTDCSFGWTCTNYTKPVYVFGDSYLGYATANRWAYYLLRDGYNQLIDGFGGRNSALALKSLKNDLLHGTPKYIFWCMGMNDPDSGSVNASWLSCVSELLEICEAAGITPILATIPNVTRSDRDNTYKNAWVRNSGYRYVDFAGSVGANALGASWYSGMLDSDGLHTSTAGAITLYHQVLSDFPEIAIT